MQLPVAMRKTYKSFANKGLKPRFSADSISSDINPRKRKEQI